MPGGEQHIAGYFSKEKSSAGVCAQSSQAAKRSQAATAKPSTATQPQLHRPPPHLTTLTCLSRLRACVQRATTSPASSSSRPTSARGKRMLLIDLAYNITMREVTQRAHYPPPPPSTHPHALAHATTTAPLTHAPSTLHSRTHAATLLTTLHPPLTHPPPCPSHATSCPTNRVSSARPRSRSATWVSSPSARTGPRCC